MKTIRKYVIEMTEGFEIVMPEHGVPLSVQFQHSQLCMWVHVDKKAPKRRYTTKVVGTGDDAPDLSVFRHIGTVQTTSGYLVLHVFLSYQGIPA